MEAADIVHAAFDQGVRDLDAIFSTYELTEAQWSIVYEAFENKYRFHFLDTLVAMGINLNKPDQDEARI